MNDGTSHTHERSMISTLLRCRFPENDDHTTYIGKIQSFYDKVSDIVSCIYVSYIHIYKIHC